MRRVVSSIGSRGQRGELWQGQAALHSCTRLILRSDKTAENRALVQGTVRQGSRMYQFYHEFT